MRKVSVFKFKAQWLQKLINYNYNYKKLKALVKYCDLRHIALFIRTM
jgi:hypothetical protein